MRFYLGTHKPSWLKRTSVPLCVSYTTLRLYKTLPQAQGPWMLDSGAFSEVAAGGFQSSTAEYIDAVGRYVTEVGNLEWAAPRDWMCEPFVVAATGLSVREHQERTVASYLELRATGLPFIPVLQGWTLGDYLRCIDLYEQAGVDLAALPVVGLGSVCRRQDTKPAHSIVATVAARGIRLHGFGVKLTGLNAYGDLLTSADSLAWSDHARHLSNTPGWKADHPHPRGGHTCANCLVFAERWRQRVLSDLEWVRPRPHALALL